MPTAGLDGARILVTGAARGLGRALVVHLAASGARVLAVDVDESGLKTGDWPATVSTRRCDVSDESDVRATVGAADDRFGGLDGLVNNAAIVDVTRAAATTLDPAEFDRVMAVNVRGPWLVYRAAAPLLALAAPDRAGGASVVNLASEVAYTGSRNLSHYATSKAAVVGLTRSLAREAGGLGIRVNAVAPGFTDTEGARALADPTTYDTARTPLGRVGSPDDMVGPVAFFLSPSSAFVTGQVLLVNGGRTTA
jgi:NAD(P)-dependent dehydrogenase (short-subunit alcohol dehydrogenase family)